MTGGFYPCGVCKGTGRDVILTMTYGCRECGSTGVRFYGKTPKEYRVPKVAQPRPKPVQVNRLPTFPSWDCPECGKDSPNPHAHRAARIPKATKGLVS